MENTFDDIIEKIEKENKLEKLLEIESKKELYSFFKENGYSKSEGEFNAEMEKLIEETSINLEDSDLSSVAGGALKDNLTKLTSAGMASLLVLGASPISSKAHASDAYYFSDSKIKSIQKCAKKDNFNVKKVILAALGVGGLGVAGAGGLGAYLIYKNHCKNKDNVEKETKKEFEQPDERQLKEEEEKKLKALEEERNQAELKNIKVKIEELNSESQEINIIQSACFNIFTELKKRKFYELFISDEPIFISEAKKTLVAYIKQLLEEKSDERSNPDDYNNDNKELNLLTYRIARNRKLSLLAYEIAQWLDFVRSLCGVIFYIQQNFSYIPNRLGIKIDGKQCSCPLKCEEIYEGFCSGKTITFVLNNTFGTEINYVCSNSFDPSHAKMIQYVIVPSTTKRQREEIESKLKSKFEWEKVTSGIDAINSTLQAAERNNLLNTTSIPTHSSYHLSPFFLILEEILRQNTNLDVNALTPNSNDIGDILEFIVAIHNNLDNPQKRENLKNFLEEFKQVMTFLEKSLKHIFDKFVDEACSSEDKIGEERIKEMLNESYKHSGIEKFVSELKKAGIIEQSQNSEPTTN